MLNKAIGKGILIGIANIVPGVSGGTILVSTGLYEEILDSIRNPFKHFSFLFKLFIGIFIGVITFSNAVNYLLTHFNIPTIYLLIGLIVGGTYKFIKTDIDEVKIGYVFLGLVSVVLQVFTGISLEVNLINFYLMGILGGSSMIVPGISGSLVLLLFGLYQPVVAIIHQITHLEFKGLSLLIVLGLGVITGIIITGIILRSIINKARVQFMNIVLGLVIGSLIVILPTSGYILSSLFAIPLSIIGFLISYKLL